MKSIITHQLSQVVKVVSQNAITTTNDEPSSNLPPLNETQAILVFFGFVGFIFLLSLIKKIYYWFWLHKRYYIIPRTQIKGIANIAMVISMSVAIIFSLTILSANSLGVIFRVYVGSRISIESILIRIGGILFGPFLGIIIGALTDLLTVILTSGIFHYGYFIAAIAYGFLSGLVKTFIVYSKNKNFNFSCLCTVLIALIIGLTVLMFENLSSDFKIDSFVSFSFLSKNLMFYAIITLCLLSVFIIWVLYPLSKYRKSARNNKPYFINLPKYGQVNIALKGHNRSEVNWYILFIASLTINLMIQVGIDLFLLPVFDISISTLPFNQWFAARFVFLWPMLFVNTILIYLVSRLVLPIVKYQYTDDMVEDIYQPLYYN
ncbi:hypothetical protein MCAV_07830 [[Mycoplasma] cavipharyngis]|uniref:ECF transporter S component n=1 Tax=[Mycoplasma] cavipharyngis TaxID=92757 RepID=UPI00370496BB